MKTEIVIIIIFLIICISFVIYSIWASYKEPTIEEINEYGREMGWLKPAGTKIEEKPFETTGNVGIGFGLWAEKKEENS